MSRRRRAVKREILPDAKFGDIVITRFMNSLMYDGKKSVAEGTVYAALDVLKRRGDRLLAIVHQRIHEARDDDVAELGVRGLPHLSARRRRDIAFPTWPLGALASGAGSADALRVEHPTQDVIPHTWRPARDRQCSCGPRPDMGPRPAPLVGRTLATLRSAEFRLLRRGRLTRVQTPRFWAALGICRQLFCRLAPVGNELVGRHRASFIRSVCASPFGGTRRRQSPPAGSVRSCGSWSPRLTTSWRRRVRDWAATAALQLFRVSQRPSGGFWGCQAGETANDLGKPARTHVVEFSAVHG